VFEQLLWSLTHRPYVTGFMIFFLLLAVSEQGWRRTLFWVASSYLIALAAEWGSINYGIPFGDYNYHYEALQHDLVIAGVPFFDTISFSFLSYVSFSFAVFFMSPLSGKGLSLFREDTTEIRRHGATLVLGSFLMMVIDLIVDPVANLGEYWFLGKIYDYPRPGIHFGVTFANYCGWFVVALATLLVNRWIDSWLTSQGHARPERRRFPGLALFSPLFWTGIVSFQLGITWMIALEMPGGLDANRILLQAVTGSYLIAPILLIAVIQVIKPSNRV
jgi:putative membrane protein